MGYLENTYFKQLDKDSWFICFFLSSHFHLGFKQTNKNKKKPHSLILNLEPNFQRNTLPETMNGIPTDNNIKHKKMDSHCPVWSLLLACQVTN